MAIRILFNRVLVKPQAKEQKTASGLIMPTSDTDNIRYGVVVATGESVDVIEVDKTVLFQRGKGIEVIYEGETYLILNDTDILAVGL